MKVYCNIIILISIGCSISCNPGKIKIGGAYRFGETDPNILKVESKSDPFSEDLKTTMEDLPGHDDLIFDPIRGVGYASGMDGWIWELDRKTGKASRWIKLPVNPAGMQYSNRNKDKILVCASRLGGESYAETDRVGLYEADIVSKTVTPLLLDLPDTKKERFETVYPVSERTFVPIDTLDSSNSRPFSLCNDLAVSKDGNRVYVTEPFEREDAAMGSGAVPEAIGLYPHGKLWVYDRAAKTVALVLDGFTFVDGILLEEGRDGIEESVIFTETTKFRIVKATFAGKNAGKHEVLFENLPGLADGLERDTHGRIWTGIIKPRSGLVNFVHSNPWIKPLILSLPQKLLPIAKKTGVLVLDREGKKALYYRMHDGSKIKDISVAVPNGEEIYFPTFDKNSRGLYSIPASSFFPEK